MQQINATNNTLLFSTLYSTVVPGAVTVDSCYILRIIVDYDIAQRSVELIKNHARIVPTSCMGDVFLNTHGHLPKTHARLIKESIKNLKNKKSWYLNLQCYWKKEINKKHKNCSH